MFSVFTCRHKKTTFPITLRNLREPQTASPLTYMVCLECGREIPYSWTQMKVLKRPQEEPAVSALLPSQTFPFK